ncbi:MAG TPA: protocatechuate 3,4-dioxygenase subunit alpha [Gaiella sp.]|nr:protocatechuate 3,4-dioxygenase subunit alpha [Gaiella sp.]
MGPFFGFALFERVGNELVAPDAPGAITIVGAVVDGNGDVVPDAIVEVWQANEAGRYADPADRRHDLPLSDGFTGFGRSDTESGGFSFVTVKPGRVPGADGALQAPHVDVAVFARGLLDRLVTRLYFPDETEANAADPLLSMLDPTDAATLVAVPDGDGLRFDIRLQGERQTVFLAV